MVKQKLTKGLNRQKNFRVYGDNENQLFLVEEVASMLRNIDSDEKMLRSISGLQCNFLTEDGLYEAFSKDIKYLINIKKWDNIEKGIG